MKNANSNNIIYRWNSGKIFLIILLLILSYCTIWVILNSSLLLLFYILPIAFIMCWKYIEITITEDIIFKHHDFRFYNRKMIIPLSFVKKFETGYDRYSNYVYKITYFKKKRNGRFSLKDEDDFQIIIKDQDDFDRIIAFFKSEKIKVDAKYPWYNDRMYNNPK